MEQLLFHGKKTVPAALRRDMWTPYFSLHFPPTIHGAEAGKLAYRRLRELSLQRQLSPPRAMVLATQKDIDDKKSKYDPLTLRDALERRDIKELPKEGERLPKKLLARRLMDQKATSVADARFVTELYLEGQTPAELRRARLMKFKSKMAQMGRRAKLRLQKIRQLEARKRDLIRLLATHAQSVRRGDGHLTLTKHAAARISAEYLGFSKSGGGLERLAKIKAAKEGKATEAELRESMADVQAQIDSLLSGQPLPQTETVELDAEDRANIDRARTEASSEADEDASALSSEETPHEPELRVKMMWADQRDSAYASKAWPQGVIHGSLERSAVSKVSTRDGTRISRSIHVIGGEQDSLWAKDPEEASEARQLMEATYKQRQDVAQLIGEKMVLAVQMLRDELDGNLPEGTRQTHSGELMEELQRNEVKVAANKQERIHQTTALEHSWWALAPEDREGVNRERAMLLARVLKLRELRKGADAEADPSRDSAKVRTEDGVEIAAPKAGWFDRVRALVWRR